MGFVEAVTLEWFEEFPEVLGFFLAHASMFDAALDEDDMLLGHFLRDFFTDGFAEFIYFTPGIAGHFDGCHQQVVLIHKHAESRGQEVLHLGMQKSHGCTPVLAGNVIIDVVHRTWTIQSHHDVDVVNRCWLEFLEGLCHAATVELE